MKQERQEADTGQERKKEREEESKRREDGRGTRDDGSNDGTRQQQRQRARFVSRRAALLRGGSSKDRTKERNTRETRPSKPFRDQFENLFHSSAIFFVYGRIVRDAHARAVYTHTNAPRIFSSRNLLGVVIISPLPDHGNTPPRRHNLVARLYGEKGEQFAA